MNKLIAVLKRIDELRIGEAFCRLKDNGKWSTEYLIISVRETFIHNHKYIVCHHLNGDDECKTIKIYEKDFNELVYVMRVKRKNI